MKSFLIIILLYLIPTVGPAQQNPLYVQSQKKRLDSLQLALENVANDTIRMELYTRLAFYYMEIKRDSSLYFRKQQLLVSQKLKVKLWEAHALDYLGFTYWYLGDYPRALQFLLKALKIAENPESEKVNSSVIKSDSVRKSRLKMLATIQVHLGDVYGSTGNIREQIFHYRLCEKNATEINDLFRLSIVNMNLGKAYINLNKLDSALSFELKALDFTRQSPYKNYTGEILKDIGTIYFKKANYTLAKEYFFMSIRESEEKYNFRALAGGYMNLANLFTQTGDLDSSLWYAKKGLEVIRSLGSPEGLVNAYTSISSIYRLRNNMDSAFIYQGLAIAEKDSLNNAEKMIQFQNIGFDEQLRLREVEEEKIKVQSRNRTYILLSIIVVFMMIAFLLFRNNRNRRRANALLQRQKEEIQEQKKNVEKTLAELKSTQSLLIQSEKMASLGELTAGIAHEIQNPLNFVNNFSELNTELIDELEELARQSNLEEVKAISINIRENEQKINLHGKRADAIVKGMLQHCRTSSGQKEPTDINALADEYLRLAYHGLRVKDKSFNVTMETDFDETIGTVNIVPQDIGRVVLNLINNAFYAVSGKDDPTVSVSTKKINNAVEIRVKDNGNGIPQKVLDKIFQPFFTTKPTGEGTGLGLSLSYDIVKAHGGELRVETMEGEGSTFIVQLPNS